MKHAIVVLAVLVAMGAALTARTHRVFGVVAVTPYEADVNKDGRVNSNDLAGVARQFGQAAPLLTPVPSVLGNRLLAESPNGTTKLVDTVTGAVIADLGVVLLGQLDTSCDAMFSLFQGRTATSDFVDLHVVSNQNG